jgi:hypothetical protein
MHIRQSAINAAMAERQSSMIDAQQMQNRGVQIIAIGHAFNGFVTEIIASPVRNAGFNSGTGKPRDEGSTVVIATVAALSKRCSPNSVEQTTSVSSIMPRCLRSVSRPRSGDQRWSPSEVTR